MVYYNNPKGFTMNPSFAGVGEAPLALLLDIIRIALMQASYAIDIDTDVDFADIVADEIVATGYGARGDAIELASKVIAVDNANNRAEFDSLDLTYVAIGNGTNDTFDQISAMREQDAGATDGNTLLIAHADVPSTTTNGGDVTLQFNTEGFLRLT